MAQQQTYTDKNGTYTVTVSGGNTTVRPVDPKGK